MRKEKIKTLVSLLFVAWILISIFLMLYFSAHKKTDLVLLLVWQYFLVFSLFVFSIDNDKSILFVLCHLTLGVCLTIIPWFLKILPVFSDLSGIRLYKIIAIFILTLIGYLFIILSRGKINKQFRVYMSTSIISFILVVLLAINICF